MEKDSFQLVTPPLMQTKDKKAQVKTETWSLSDLTFTEPPPTISPLEVELPNKLPLAFDLSQIPPQVARSQTVETLIRQNEDLYSRLNVTLRRNHILEEQQISFEDQTSALRKECNVLQDQILMLREQEKSYRNRNEYLEKNMSSFQSENATYQTRFAEMHKALQTRLDDAKDQQKRLERQILRYRKYRRAIREKVQLFVRYLKNEIISLKDQLRMRSDNYRELQARMSDTVQYLQRVSRDGENNIRSLAERYEIQISELKQKADLFESHNRALEEKTKNFERIAGRNAELENELIGLKRRMSDVD
jgi:chromosome segregation ATPase